MIRPILTDTNPTLRQISTLIPKHNDPSFIQLSTDLLDTLKHSDNGIGLAAPQIGELQRVIVVMISRTPTVMIDPIITKKREEFEFVNEMCLSFPGVSVNKQRFKLITVQYTSVDGNSVKIKLSGLESICVQHEIDHLNGVVIGDNQ